eukprot:NODE_3187_length_2077_cov_12.277436.p1 GENE.NODE_3187_length_2077_cov_12.277436~~NODE_3187_length_2077_cov_12.277436.p1  ORF type:complete len:606 (+),score=129.83 NODE_3187_length_2077_cov_12.277436:38-1855(+)
MRRMRAVDGTSADLRPVDARTRTNLVSRMQTWLLKLFVISPMRALPLLAQLYCLWWLSQAIASSRRAGRNFGATVAAAARFAASVWLPLEAAHGLFYTLRKAEHERPKQRTELASTKQRSIMLTRWLESVEDIHAADASGGLVMLQSTSMSEILGPTTPGTKKAPARASSATRLPKTASVENLLRARAQVHDGPKTSLSNFKRVELCSFFYLCNRAEDIGALDFVDLIAHWFFHGARPEELDAEQQSEIASLVRILVDWARLPPPSPGRNKRIVPILPYQIRLVSLPRPLAIYMLTGCAGLLDDTVLYCIGFRRYELAGFVYYRLPARDMHSAPRLGASLEKRITLPIVFIHGLGLGIMMYLTIIRGLADLGEEVFLVLIPPILMRPFTNMPSPRELADLMHDMLKVWGHARAHFFGHSFGTIACAWVQYHAPSIIAVLTLADPVCFFFEKCMIKIVRDFSLLPEARYQDGHQMTALDEFLKYFALQELEISRVLQRASVTPENSLWPEKLQRTPTLLFLASNDSICPAHMVRYLVAAELSRRAANTAPMSVLWVDGAAHGSFLVQPRVARDLFGMISRMHLEGDLWLTRHEASSENSLSSQTCH